MSATRDERIGISTVSGTCKFRTWRSENHLRGLVSTIGLCDRRNHLAHDEDDNHAAGKVARYLLTKRYARVSSFPAKSRVTVEGAGRYSCHESCPSLTLLDRHFSRRDRNLAILSRRRSLVADHLGSRSSLSSSFADLSQDVQILAALRFAVARPYLVEQVAHLQAGAGPTAAVLLRRIVLRARAQRRLAAILPRSLPEHLAGSLGVLQLEADLREQADQQLVDVVVDAHGRLDELAVVRRRHGLTLCNRDRLSSVRVLLLSSRFEQTCARTITQRLSSIYLERVRVTDQIGMSLLRLNLLPRIQCSEGTIELLKN